MADKKLPFSDVEEEEFHITDDDIDRELEDLDAPTADNMSSYAEPSAVSMPEDNKKSFVQSLLSNRKRLVIAIIALLIVIYAISKMFGTKNQNFDNIQPVSHAVATKVKAAEPREKMLANVQSSTTASSPMPVTTNQSADISSTLEPMTTPVESPVDAGLAKQVVQLQSDNQALTAKLSEVSEQLGQMTSLMNTLNNKVDTIQQPAEMSVAPVAAAPALTAEEPIVATKEADDAALKTIPGLITDQHYYVEAVVPGRAWIQAANGETITVTVGEDIKGLGNVVSIDSMAGEVVTTSGEIVKYGPN